MQSSVNCSSGKISWLLASFGSRSTRISLTPSTGEMYWTYSVMSAATSRVVDVVHERQRRGRVRGADGDHHVVGPQHAALVRHPPLDVRVVGLELDRVAGPADRRDDVAAGQVVGVVVAGEVADLTRGRRLLDLRRSRRASPRRWRDSGSTPSAFITSGTVSRISLSNVDLALVLGVEEVVDRGHVGCQVLADDDPGHPALPRHRVVALRVEGRALQARDQVLLDVRDRLLVEVLDVAEVVHLLRHPVGRNDDRATARLALGELRPAACRRTRCCR